MKELTHNDVQMISGGITQELAIMLFAGSVFAGKFTQIDYESTGLISGVIAALAVTSRGSNGLAQFMIDCMIGVAIGSFGHVVGTGNRKR